MNKQKQQLFVIKAATEIEAVLRLEGMSMILLSPKMQKAFIAVFVAGGSLAIKEIYKAADMEFENGEGGQNEN